MLNSKRHSSDVKKKFCLKQKVADMAAGRVRVRCDD